MDDSRRKDGSGLAHVVPCGKCVKCLGRRRKGWGFRLMHELKDSSSAAFITLTYETPPMSFNEHETLEKRDVQLFLKRLRKYQTKKYPNEKPIKYYICGEYGTRTKRPHYHAIMYNVHANILADTERLQGIWSHGHIHLGDVNMATVMYTASYIMKGAWQPEQDDDDRVPEFSMMSKKLGASFMTPQMVRYFQNRFISYATLEGGEKIALPRYFREKIFDKLQRKELSEIAKQMAEFKAEDLFKDASHEVLYKKDLIRQDIKKKRLERLKI